jgi:cobalt/nickel transport system permease protein
MIGGQGGVIFGAMVAAWFSVILASGAFAVELAASGRHGHFLTVLGWMALVHAGIGLGEALITGMVIRFILLTRPDLIYDPKSEPGSSSGRWSQVLVGGLAIALAIAIFLAPFASGYDDGLEWVGGKLGFLKEAPPIIPAPIPDYKPELPGLTHPKLATAIAGLVGTLVVFGVGFGLARGVARGRPVERQEIANREDSSS